MTPTPDGTKAALPSAGPAEKQPYDDPRLHDLLYLPGTAATVRGLLAIFRRYAAPGSRRPIWLEPACGTGRYLRCVAARGIQAAGFDRNRTFLDYARRRLAKYGRKVRLFEAGMASFADNLPAGSIDFAFNLDNTIRHLESDAALVRHLAGMRRVLKPGGIYAVGLSLTRPAEEITEDFWSATRGRTKVELLVQYFPTGTGPGEGSSGRREEVVQHRVVTRPSGVEHADFRYFLRCFTRSQWERLVHRAGLRTIAVVDATGDPIDPEVYAYAIHLLGDRASRRSMSSSYSRHLNRARQRASG